MEITKGGYYWHASYAYCRYLIFTYLICSSGVRILVQIVGIYEFIMAQLKLSSIMKIAKLHKAIEICGISSAS